MSTKVPNTHKVPIYQIGKTSGCFAVHDRMPFTKVEFEDGTSVLSSYVAANGKVFDIFGLCGTDGSTVRKLAIKEIAYVDDGDNLKFHEVQSHQPVEIPQGDRNWQFGFVTKLENLRWGVNILVDGETGETRIHADRESPIIGLKFALVP